MWLIYDKTDGLWESEGETKIGKQSTGQNLVKTENDGKRRWGSGLPWALKAFVPFYYI